jgi:hypothetical protein
MTNSELHDAGAHLSKAAWKYAQDLVSMGFPGAYAIQEAELVNLAIKEGANTKEAIYEKKSA